MLGRLISNLIAQPVSKTIESAAVRIPVLDLPLVWVIEHLKQLACSLSTDLRLEFLIPLIPRFDTQVVVLVLI